MTLGGSARAALSIRIATGTSGSTTVTRSEPTTCARSASTAPSSSPGRGGGSVNGGAWLTVEDQRVDLLYRDLDVAQHWLDEADAGRYEVDQVEGYLAGMATYVLAGELALAEVLAGELPRPGFPDALRQAAPGRWRRSAGFSLAIADTAATRHDVVSCAGLLAKAAVEAAQAALAERGEWALNEKAIVRRAALSTRVETIIAAPGDRPFELSRAVSAMRAALGIRPADSFPREWRSRARASCCTESAPERPRCCSCTPADPSGRRRMWGCGQSQRRYAEGEDPLACALREFEEELGVPPPTVAPSDLGSTRQAGGKLVRALAAEGDLDPTGVRSNTFTLEWPPRSGVIRSSPRSTAPSGSPRRSAPQNQPRPDGVPRAPARDARWQRGTGPGRARRA